MRGRIDCSCAKLRPSAASSKIGISRLSIENINALALASTIGDIDAAFTALLRERLDAFFVLGVKEAYILPLW
jgi:hypothetical protein